MAWSEMRYRWIWSWSSHSVPSAELAAVGHNHAGMQLELLEYVGG